MMSAQLLIRRDRIKSLKSSLAERDMFIEIIGMCNEFEEFLSK
jgi:hypothetical protein